MAILGSTNPPQFPVGESDYALLRRQKLTYVDKTMWVADVLGNSSKVLLVPRPRRFGKTLNMSTLYYFLSRSDEDRTDLFGDTAVWTAQEGRFRQHFQRYPVIYLTFKDLKEPTMEGLARRLGPLVATAVRALARSVPGDHEPTSDDMRIASLQDPTRPLHEYTDALLDASRWLHHVTGQQAVILIDEYDAPLHAAWQHGYWDEASLFFRNFLSAGLKDNRHLFKGVLTGILKVAKEGIFSVLNHLETASLLSDGMSEHFGFREPEVEELVRLAGQGPNLPALRHWYNGYRIGGAHPVTVYNPWSVLSYLKSPGLGPRSFWKNTSDNAIIHTLLRRFAGTMGRAVQAWLDGGTIERIVDENVALVQLERDVGAVFGLLLFSGYLTVADAWATEDGIVTKLRIPNVEVAGVFREVFRGWIDQASSDSGASPSVEILRTALLGGDATSVEEVLGSLLLNMLSYHDLAGDRVEAVFHAFIVGLLIHLDATHRVTSNRELGFGRADVLILPRQPGPGAVLELKRVLTRETSELALDRAVDQLVARNYAAEVYAAGATTVHQYAVVFDGKRCWVKAVPVG